MSEEQRQPCNMPQEGNDTLHEALWKACAGPSVDLPMLGEYVYYFPQGHLEQLEESSMMDLDQNVSLRDSKILCQVISIQFLAEVEADELYAQITLLRDKSVPEPKSPQYLPDFPKPTFNSFSKSLTASDTNGHCRLHVRKKDAENCLPPLGTNVKSSTLVAKDLYGNDWTFKHVHAGSPSRHLFTQGWKTFVDSKKLAQKDSFVLLRGGFDELRVGVRRHQSIVKPPPTIPSGIAQVIATAATEGLFDVVYRPRKSQFVIGLNKYLQAAKHNFSIGMRIKMQVKGDDPVKRMCIGTIIGIEDISPRWKNSEWRALEVQWDHSAHGTLPERVSSWEILPLVSQISKGLIQIGRKRQHEITFLPVLRKRSILEVQDEQMELGEMAEEPPQPPVASSEAKGERLHDNPVAFPKEGCEILNQVEYVQELNHDNYPATCGAEVSSSHGTTQPSSIQFSMEGINITGISHAIRSGSSPTSEGIDAWFNYILQDFPEQAPRQQSLLEDPLVLPQWTSSTGQKSSATEIRVSSVPSLIPFYGAGNGNEMENWEGYTVPQSCIPILDRIIKQYPNTLSSFRLMSNTFHFVFLYVLAKVVIMLERLTVENMDEEQLGIVKRHIMDLKISGIDVNWLERRLEHIIGLAKRNILARNREELVKKMVEATATLRQLERELISVDIELEKVSFCVGAEPLLSANHSVMQGLL